ncbi:putative solute-binding protein [Isoalcanivorax beigongshangi]|uniref:Solute-binding protein n=1 Tax=Isoalcanivorax beigongshangi TaxID=3238810 RepID=A0ABV4AJF8_9GAMM
MNAARFLLLSAGLALAAPLLSTPAIAAPKLKVCVWDIAGNAGPAMQAMREWQLEAVSWGLEVELLPHTNEGIAAEELKSNQCDATLMTGIRARQFNKYTGSLDSIGSIPDDAHFRTAMQVLSHPQSAARMIQGPYTVMGVAPAGAAYIFVNDRNINTLAKAAGKKVAVLEYDPTQAQLVAQVGATPVASDITNFSSRFNNGQVDVIASPLVAYGALELYRGLAPNGAIINYPLMQITLQLVGRSDKFSPEIAQKSREYFFNNLARIQQQLSKEAERVDPKWFQDIPAADKQEYEIMMQEARVQLRNTGHYDADMMSLLHRIRCRVDGARSECTDPVE